MTIDQPQKPVFKTGQQEAIEEPSAPRGGWKIKKRREPAKSRPKQRSVINAEQQGSSSLREPSALERKLNIGPSLTATANIPPMPEKGRSFSLSRLRLPMLLLLGLVAAGAILTPLWGHVERWFDGASELDQPNQASANNAEQVRNPDLSIRAVVLPALENEGDLPVYFRLSAPADWPIDVAYRTEAHTAEADTDFASTEGTVTIQPGQLLVELSIPLIDDDVVETAELFRVILSVDPELATMSDTELTATVLDDDYKKQE